jgi:(2Fe-2S) ferredoxin
MNDPAPPVPYARHVFVCTNRRPPGSPRGSCAEKGSEELRDRLKALVKERKLPVKVRVNAAGCLDFCERGATVCVYPENVWYGGVRVADAEEIVDRHLARGEVVARLLVPREFLV